MKKILLLLAFLLMLASCDAESEGNAKENEIVQAGVYTFSGENAPITVNAGKDDLVEIVLDGARIDGEGKAAIRINSAQKVTVTLADGSESTLRVTKAFDESDSGNAVIFSKADLVFNGNGSLILDDPYGHGVEGNDGIEINGGVYTVNASGHGFEANDLIAVSGGSFDIVSQKDGFHAGNSENAEKGYITISGGSFNITSGLDGISASAYMTLEGGSFNITAGSRAENVADKPAGMEKPQRPEGMQMPEGAEIPQRPEGMGGGRGQGGMRPDKQWGAQVSPDTNTESMKGIKAGGVLTVNGGVYNINSADDCLHSNADLKINGGAFTLDTDDDGFHADKNLSFTDGEITVTASYEALEGESIDVSGGTFTLKSSDDGLNAAGGNDQSGFGFRGDAFGSTNSYINISGGNILLDASGDGVDSNGSLSVSGGSLTVLGPLSGGDAPVDWQTSGEISGGRVIAVGNSSMAMNFSKASQGSVFLTLDSYTDSKTTVSVTDADGTLLLEAVIEKSFNCILLSSPDLKENGSYTVTVNGVEYPVTLEGYVYSDKSSGFGGFGGGFGGRGNKNNI